MKYQYKKLTLNFTGYLGSDGLSMTLSTAF